MGDWRDVLPPRAPFDLVFLDSGDAATDPAVAALVAPGGLLVKDDLAPRSRCGDPVRQFWTSLPGFITTEVVTTSTTAALIATRVAPHDGALTRRRPP